MGEVKTVDLEIVRGDTLKIGLEFGVELENGQIVPEDISNVVVFFTAKPDYLTKDDKAPIKAEFPSSLFGDPKNGVIILPIDTSSLEAKTYLYDIQVVRYNPNNPQKILDIQTYIRGKLKVFPDVTKRTNVLG